VAFEPNLGSNLETNRAKESSKASEDTDSRVIIFKRGILAHGIFSHVPITPLGQSRDGTLSKIFKCLFTQLSLKRKYCTRKNAFRDSFTDCSDIGGEVRFPTTANHWLSA